MEIAVVGKYVTLRDAYLSVMEALRHGGFEHGADVQIRWVASDDLGGTATDEALHGVDGVLIPGGFGIRGVEGKVAAVRYAREQRSPVPGHLPRPAVRGHRVRAQRRAASTAPTPRSSTRPRPHPVIDLLPEQKNVTDLGASMRLGAQACYLVPGTKAAAAYGVEVVEERHRHRWEVNPAYHETLEANGLVMSGNSQKGRLTEIIELPDHPFFMAGQFHPELAIASHAAASAVPRVRGRRPGAIARAARRVAIGLRRRDRPSRGRSPGRAASRSRGRSSGSTSRTGPASGRGTSCPSTGAAAVLPLTARRPGAVLVKQFRPAVRQVLTEIPAGLLDVEGEDALTCAARELFEETGYRHTAIEFLGRLLRQCRLHRRVRPRVLGACPEPEPVGTVEAGIEVVTSRSIGWWRRRGAERSATRRRRSRCCWPPPPSHRCPSPAVE